MYILKFSLSLADEFGDGWDKAKLMVMSSSGNHSSYAPKCGGRPVVKEYCFNPNLSKTGDYVAIGVVGYKPHFAWEVCDIY